VAWEVAVGHPGGEDLGSRLTAAVAAYQFADA
jgi:hypothetical protein